MNERRAELIYGQVLQRMDMTRETGDEELQELIRMTLEEASEKEYLPLNEKIELSRELFHAFRKLDILQELLEDPKITEIMVNGTDHIFYEKGGRSYQYFFGKARQAVQSKIKSVQQLFAPVVELDLIIKGLYDGWLLSIRHRVKESTTANYQL